MRIAVLGAGYAGLAVTWYLLVHSQNCATIDLFDPVPLNEGASGLSSGLLHAFTGRKAIKAPLADAALIESHYLLTQAEKSLQQGMLLSQGILRPAIEPEQIEIFHQRVKEFPSEVEWWDQGKCAMEVPGLTIPANSGALFIKKGITINNTAYIEGLWNSCAAMGTQFYDELIENLDDIREFYDHIIITPGAHLDTLKETNSLPLNKVRGQMLEIQWPEHVPIPKYSINAHKYLVMNAPERTCLVGATFEHQNLDEAPDTEAAKQEIMPTITSLFPELANAKILGCRAGLRCSSPSRLPVITRLEEKIWFLGGLGSKGLLYHGLTGNMLAKAVLQNNTAYIAKEFLLGPERTAS